MSLVALDLVVAGVYSAGTSRSVVVSHEGNFVKIFVGEKTSAFFCCVFLQWGRFS